jgi:mRNA-degrading endonuclease toxin of MazEF toxin-antitoxin module
VVSADARNQRRDDFIVVPFFANGRAGPTRIPVAVGTGGLPHDSVLFCEQLTTIVEDFLAGGPLGPPVADELLEQVVRAVRRALGEIVPDW